MNEILRCLKKVFDSNAIISKWNASEHLSLALAHGYDYYLVSMLSVEFLIVRPLEAKSVQKLKSQLSLIQDKSQYEITVLVENATPYMIKKMLEEQISFLELDKQMYLPFIALHIRNNRKSVQKELTYKKFSPTTQLIYLAILYWEQDIFESQDIANRLQVSDITISRATTELEALGLLSSQMGGKTGRKKIFKRINKKEYYALGKEHLQNQIMKTVFVKKLPEKMELYKGGVTALAEQTMLGEPEQEIYAMYSKKAKDLIPFQISVEQAMEEKSYAVQLIKYDVGVLAKGDYVDPITLILGLDEVDDRTEIAIDELMENATWYEG